MGTEGMMTAGVVIYLCLLGNLLRAAVCGSQRYLAAKMTNSAGFVALGVFFAFLSSHLSYLAWILPALLLCFLGDFFIGLFRKHYGISPGEMLKNNR